MLVEGLTYCSDSVLEFPISVSQTTPKLAGLKQHAFYYFSGFCELDGAQLGDASTGLTWSLSCSCIHMVAMAECLSSFFSHMSVPQCSGFFLQQGGMILFRGSMGSKKEEAEVASLPKIWAQRSHNALCAIFSW